jgi:hypothetical protein
VRFAVAAALSSMAVLAPGDRAAGTFQSGTLRLTLHYLMTCGQPGSGPLAVTLPKGFRIVALHAALAGKPVAVSQAGRTIDVALPKPPQVTCMSITEGTLRAAIGGLRASSGTYAVAVQVNRHSFSLNVRVG